MKDPTLEEIIAASFKYDDALKELKKLIAVAVERRSLTMKAIANATGKSRQTIYRWANEAGGVGGLPYSDPVQAMHEALTLMLGDPSAPVTPINQALQVKNEQAKARRVLLASKHLSSSFYRDLDDEDRSLLNAGITAAQVTLGELSSRDFPTPPRNVLADNGDEIGR